MACCQIKDTRRILLKNLQIISDANVHLLHNRPLRNSPVVPLSVKVEKQSFNSLMRLNGASLKSVSKVLGCSLICSDKDYLIFSYL